jgi:5-methylthioadenosine/S-adenosylhomocysteine deaminase
MGKNSKETPRGESKAARPDPTRRRLLASSATLMSVGIPAHLLPSDAAAQGGDPELTQLQSRRSILIKGGVVLTLASNDFAKADVLIADGRIREIGPEIAASGDMAQVDATNRILIPGFVDTHSHSYQGILRSILPNGRVDPDYNRDIQNLLTPAFSPSDVYAGVLMSALGFIEMGTTAIVDLSQIGHSPEHSDACIRALQEAGIRALFGYGRGIGPAMRYPQDLARLQRTYFNSRDQLLTLALASSLDPQAVTAARAAGIPAVMHYRVNPAPVIALSRAGMLREGDAFIHTTHLDNEAWQVIKGIGARVSLSPPLEMAMGHGFPAIQEALDQGVRPSLSSDHGTTVAQDMFSIMRTTFNLQRLGVQQRMRRNEPNLPPLLSCREVLSFATLAGARFAGLDDKIGTLAPGKEADIVMLRADTFDLWPLNNAPGVVTNMMNPSHVDAVFIAGKVKKWRGNLVGIDRARIMRLAQNARDAVMARAGFKIDLLG